MQIIYSFIDSFPDAFLLFDANLNLMRLNPAAQRILGLFAEEAVGKNISDVMPGIKEICIYDRYQSVLRTGKPFFSEALLPGPRFGETPLSVKAFKVGDGLGIVASESTEGLGAKDKIEKLTHFLNERIKEMNCLYSISKLTANMDISLKDIFERTINIMPSAWQYPEITAARIILPEQEIKAPNFRETEWKQSSAIMSQDKQIGTLEVYYLERMPESDEGPFLKEERELLNEIAEQLGLVTERKKAKEALRKEKETAQQYLDIVEVIIIAADTNRTVTLINKKGAEILGYPQAEIIGKDGTSIIFPETYQDKAKNRFDRFIAGDTESLEYTEAPVLTREGKVKIIEWHNSLCRDESGNITGILLSGNDITERKNAEEALRKHQEQLEELVKQRTGQLQESENKYRTLFESSTDAIMTLDRIGFIDCNTATLKMFAFNQKSEFISLHPADVSPSNQPDGTDSRVAADRRIAEAFEKGSSQFEWAHRRGNGQDFPADVLLTALKIGEKQVLHATVRDLTEKKMLQEKLIVSERLATLGQFSGSLAHELRNSLATVSSSAYYLKSKLTGEGEKIQTHLERIKSGVDSATSIIQSLLNLTRMREPNLAKLDLREIVSGVTGADAIPSTVRVIRNLPEQAVEINADREQLRIAFRNLVDNAVQAMENKGTLTAIVRNIPDGKAEVSFADTGPGIPKENLEKIFEPLFSTKTKGIGLGLSIAKMVIDRHSGTIEAKSELVKGATLIIRLPGNLNR